MAAADDGGVRETQLALEWLGGATERRLRRTRPHFDDLPWHTFDLTAIRDGDDDGARADLDEARAVWTNGVFTEYASGAAFNAMSLAFMQCGAPVERLLVVSPPPSHLDVAALRAGDVEALHDWLDLIEGALTPWPTQAFP